MPTSKNTNQEIAKILDKYLSQEKQVQLFTELSKVDGNSSFRMTITSLLSLIKLRKELNLETDKEKYEFFFLDGSHTFAWGASMQEAFSATKQSDAPIQWYKVNGKKYTYLGEEIKD